LFVESGCGPCEALVRQLSDDDELVEGVRLLLVTDDSEEARRVPVPAAITVLHQTDRSASRAFRNLGMPQAFLVEPPVVVVDRRFVTSRAGLRHLARQASDAELVTAARRLAPGGVA
jgi:hypothetical protein